MPQVIDVPQYGCPNCGQPVTRATQVCPACGHDLSEAGQAAPAPPWAVSTPPFVSPSGRGTVAIVFLALATLCNAVLIPPLLSRINLVNRALSGQQVSETEMEASDALVQGIAVAEIGLVVLTAIAFLVWLYRAYKNLPALGAGSLRFTPGWAVGYWFIPFINLVRPYQIVRETFDESVLGGASGIAGAWWAAWLLSGFISRASSRLTNTPDTFVAGQQGLIVSAVVTILAGVLAILIVRSINQGQEERFRRLYSRSSGVVE